MTVVVFLRWPRPRRMRSWRSTPSSRLGAHRSACRQRHWHSKEATMYTALRDLFVEVLGYPKTSIVVDTAGTPGRPGSQIGRIFDGTAWPSFAQFEPVPADAAFRTGDQRAISACTKRSNFAGVRSLLGGIDPPSSATFGLTPGSSRELSSAAASWARMGFGVPLGAKIPAQMLI